nr:hypothetical protein [uncultured Flavobacterium sp.]
MKKNQIKELLLSTSLSGKNSDLEFVIFESIYDLCLEKNHKIENYFEITEDCSLCEQQKFVHLVAMNDDEILDLVFEFHKTFSETEFCKEDLVSKLEFQLLENTFEISL